MLARDPDKLPQNPTYPVEVFHGSLKDTALLGNLVSGADAIIHCAGTVRGVQLSDFKEANIDAVSNLIEAQKKLSTLPRFFLISSLAAREPSLSHYANSKRQGEELLKQNASAIDWTIVRPAAIYGDGDKELKPLLDLLKYGMCLQLSDSGSRFSLIHVDDVARAVLQWLENGTANREVIEIDDGTVNGYNWRDIKHIASRVFGKQVRTIKIPNSVLNGLGRVSELTARIINTSPMLSTGKIRELTWHDWVCDHTDNHSIENWAPEIQFEQGLIKLYQS